MKTKILTSLAALAFLCSSAVADISVTEITTPINANSTPPLIPISGSTYTIVSGIGGAGGFASSVVAPTDSVINNGTETNGTDLFGATLFSSDNLLTNGGGNFDFVLTLSGGDLAPGGFAVGGLPADTAALFIGTAAGGTPVQLQPHVVNFATIEAFDAGGNSLFGVLDISGLGSFASGEFDGNLGVSFGAGSAGLGISSYQLRVNLNVVPEPASVAVLSLLSLGMLIRRR